MGDWPLEEAARISSYGFTTTIPTGVTVTCGAANVKGAYAVVGNAPHDSDSIWLMVGAKSVATDYLVDIAFGASGSERVVIENILYTGNTSGAGAKTFFFPLKVPANTRVTVRAQSAGANTIQVGIHFFEASFEGMPSCNRFITYGSVPSTSSGTALAAPGAGAWGAWTTITPATAADHIWIMGILGDQDISTRTASQKWAWQVGEGSAGNEYIVQPETWFTSTSTVFGISAFYGTWQSVPIRERLSMRYGASAALTLGADGVIIAGCD
jgi:hypothetical protein